MNDDLRQLLKMLFFGIEVLAILGVIISFICWIAG
jgi:hypothetical protein